MILLAFILVFLGGVALGHGWGVIERHCAKQEAMVKLMTETAWRDRQIAELKRKRRKRGPKTEEAP